MPNEEVTSVNLEQTALINRHIVELRKVLSFRGENAVGTSFKLQAAYAAIWYYLFELKGMKIPPMDVMNILVERSVVQCMDNLHEYIPTCPEEFKPTK